MSRLLFIVCLASGMLALAEEQPLDVETILGTAADKEDYVDVAKCIPLHRIRSVEVLDERHVAFRISRDQFYLVQMKNRCPGLNRGSKVSYETRGSRVCALDSIRGVIEFGTASRFGPPCSIPGFQEITREQLVLITETLRNKK